MLGISLLLSFGFQHFLFIALGIFFIGLQMILKADKQIFGLGLALNGLFLVGATFYKFVPSLDLLLLMGLVLCLIVLILLNRNRIENKDFVLKKEGGLVFLALLFTVYELIL